jgi:hypothetical protein
VTEKFQNKKMALYMYFFPINARSAAKKVSTQYEPTSAVSALLALRLRL